MAYFGEKYNGFMSVIVRILLSDHIRSDFVVFSSRAIPRITSVFLIVVYSLTLLIFKKNSSSAIILQINGIVYATMLIAMIAYCLSLISFSFPPNESPTACSLAVMLSTSTVVIDSVLFFYQLGYACVLILCYQSNKKESEGESLGIYFFFSFRS